MTWHFVISAVWAGTLFFPHLWQHCSYWRSLADSSKKSSISCKINFSRNNFGIDVWFPENPLDDLTIVLIPVFTCKFFAFCPISHNANPHKKWRLMLQHQHAWQMGSSFNVQTTYLKCLKGIWGYNYWCHFTLKYSTHNYSSF